MKRTFCWCLTSWPPPPPPPTNTQQLPKEGLKTCLEWTPPPKTSPQMSLQQGSPEVGERTLPFDIELSSRRISTPIFFWQAIRSALSVWDVPLFLNQSKKSTSILPLLTPPPNHQKENHNFPTVFVPTSTLGSRSSIYLVESHVRDRLGK